MTPKPIHEREASALVAAVIIVIILMTLGIALATLSLPYAERSHAMNSTVAAGYAAEAMLEKAWFEIASSPYSSEGNEWLIANSGPEPDGVLIYTGVPVGSAVSSLRIYDRGNQWYRLEAAAEAGPATRRVRVVVAQDVRGRDAFSRYLFFVDMESITFGTSTVRGFVHSNEGIVFNYGGARFFKEVSAVEGFTYAEGATPQNTTFYGGSNPAAEDVRMPSTSQIATLHNNAQAGYKFIGVGDEVQVTLLGDQVRLVAHDQTGRLLSDQVLPLPSNGLIFVQGNVVLQGEISGRLTIATMGKVDVVNRVRYRDADGNLPYVLKHNGVVVPDNATPQGVKWLESDGYVYEPNPAYRPDPAAPPALGIMAQNSVEITEAAPWNMEFQAAVYSSQGNWNCNLEQVKGNLRVLGSLVSKRRGWRYSTSDGGRTWRGWGASGEYIYDDNLLNRPPPFYLQVDKPSRGARWVMNVNEAHP
jgi:hypothetical protein